MYIVIYFSFPFYSVRDGNQLGEEMYYRTTAVTPTITITLPFTTYIEYVSVYPQCEEYETTRNFPNILRSVFYVAGDVFSLQCCANVVPHHVDS